MIPGLDGRGTLSLKDGLWREHPARRILRRLPVIPQLTLMPSPADGEHVLIVDDDPGVLWFTVRILAGAGFRTTSASDGLAALDMVRQRPRAFDAVVSDIVMPKLDGVALLRHLSHLRPSLPVVLMSGYAPPELHERGVEAPCAVLPKPCDPDALVDAVRECIDGWSPPSRPGSGQG
jgi:two-component system, cell cycle sensor histidine kinase and response regulator CckA